MQQPYALDFTQIPAALAANPHLRDTMLSLVEAEPVAGKVTEGGDRLPRLRAILRDLTSGTINIYQAIHRAEAELPRDGSPHAGSNRVFADGWAERLVRTQYSRFYNQAVLTQLTFLGVQTCFVPHSTSEDPKSPCSQLLAGRSHSVPTLMALLTSAYGGGRFLKTPKVPDYPHCTHVVTPPPAVAASSPPSGG